MHKLFCIAAGQEHTRKIHHAINKKHLYLNYGLLSIATLLSRYGVQAIQVQGNFDTAEETFRACNLAGLSETPMPIFLSIPSFYAVSWAKSFIALAKQQAPLRKIIVGGRWVVDGHPELLHELLEKADLIVEGLAEPQFDSLFKQFVLPHIRNGISVRGFSNNFASAGLDYRILTNRTEYQPSLEVSRGCGMGCSFCQERDEPLSKLKSAKDIVAELKDILVTDEHSQMTPYFEASIFAPSRTWAESLKSEFKSNDLTVRWRSEARVDSIKPETLGILAEAGLSVLDLGLESASPLQLQRMQKTKDPIRYLKKASVLLREARANDVKVKVNVLMFAGETHHSFNETIEWLEEHRDCISGLSVGPVMVFGWECQTNEYFRELTKFGASASLRSGITGVQELNLSPEIDASAALEISQQTSRSFMNADQYFALKSFSYLPRSYKYSNFTDDVRQSKSIFSFSTNNI